MKTVAFFNNKGSVGKTTLVYHLAWMLAERGEQVLAVDLDPQANLTSMFLPEDVPSAPTGRRCAVPSGTSSNWPEVSPGDVVP